MICNEVTGLNQMPQDAKKQAPVADWHLHTHYSADVPTGWAAFREYCQLGEQYDIQVGFLDHFELPEFRDNPKYALFGEQGMRTYLEEFEAVQAEFPTASLGLEVDYYPEWEAELGEVLDTYRADFTRYIGSVHVIEGKAITLRDDCRQLLKKYRFTEVREKYFQTLEAAMESQLFDGLAHIDVLYRFANELFDPGALLAEDPEVLRLGKHCKTRGLQLELNLSGLEQGVKRTYPALEVVKTLHAEGVTFFVGSDSHVPRHFVRRIERIRKMNQFLARLGGPLGARFGRGSKAGRDFKTG
jgi:histidinol-phosphatase (PHP family)